LIIALVFLLMLTVLGVAGMQGTTQQERMSGNMYNRNLAFQAAETALRAGENFVDPPNKTGTPPTCTRPEATAFDNNGADGLVSLQTTGGDDGAYWMAWDWQNKSRQLSSNTLAEVADQPRYVIEDISNIDPLCAGATPPTKDCFRITARGVGGTADAVVILQSTYKWEDSCNKNNP
jgi:type IV pilus assembly protein PilX